MGNSSSSKADVALQKAVALLQKCRDMSIDFSDAKVCFDLAVEEYAGENYENAEKLVTKSFDIIMKDINARRKEINTVRIRSAVDVVPIMLDDGIRLWPLFSAGSLGDIISPQIASPMEYVGLLGEIEVDAGRALESQQFNNEVYYYILQGQGVVSFGDQEVKVRRSDWVFVPNNSLHSIRPVSNNNSIRLFVLHEYADRRTSELLTVGTNPLDLIKVPTPYDGSVVEAMVKLAAKAKEATDIGVSLDTGGSRYREGDFYIEVARRCYGKNELGVRKYAALAINMIQRFIDDTKYYNSYKTDVTRLKANAATFPGEWLHESTSLDWFIYADSNLMKPEWGRPTCQYTMAVVDWAVPPQKALTGHTHNTEEFWYCLSGEGGLLIGPPGTHKYTGDEKEVLFKPGDCLFIPPNTRHGVKNLSTDFWFYALAAGQYSDEVISGDAAVY